MSTVSRPLQRLRTALSAARRRPIVQELLGFGASTIALQASRVGAGLVAAGILGPAEWGTWYLLNLVIVYGALTHLGVLNALNREVPAALARGEAAAAASIRSNALGMTLVGTGSVTLVVLVGSAVAPSPVSLPQAAAILALLWGHQIFDYVAMTLKSATKFLVLARLQWLVALLHPLLAVGGAWFFGLYGFVVGQVVVLTCAGLATLALRDVSYRARFRPSAVKPLIAIGFPILLVGLIYVMFTTVDRWVIAAFMDAASLGHYSIAIMAFGAVGLLPQVVAQLYYPRMAHAWAARADLNEMRQLSRQIRNMTLLVAAPAAAATALLLPAVVRSFLPEYVPGVPALLITMLAPVIGAFGQGYGLVLHMLDRQVWLVGIIAMAAVVNLVVSVGAVATYGLEGVAAATIVSFVVYSVGRIVLGTVALRTEKRPRSAR
jgi:O-antigen/teichoic acid export membrane protein